MRRFIGGIFLAVLAVATAQAFSIAFAQPAPADDTQTIKSFTLENGLRVMLVPDFRSPVVVHMVWYPAGAVDEPAGQSGIAHMLEHMMFKGTDDVPPGEFSKRVAKLGGQDNAFTSQDYTAYYQKIARNNLAKVARLEADRMANLNISDKHFRPERDVILEERSTRVDNKPISLFFEKFNKHHFPEHPYGDPVIGWREEIKNYTLENAVNWYNTHYRPESAIAVFAGALAEDEAKWLAKHAYSDISNGDIENGKGENKSSRAEIEPAPLFDAPKRFTHTDPRTQLPLFVRSYRAPSLQAGIAGGDPASLKEAAALTVLADVLGGGLTSRLYKTLVMEKKLADSARASYRPVRRYEASFSVVVQPRDGVSVGKVEQAVDGVLEKFLRDGITPDALKRAKMQAKSGDVFARDDLFESAYRLGRWLTVGGTVKQYQNWLSSIEAVTAQDVQQMAEKVLTLKQSTTGILRPGEETEK